MKIELKGITNNSDVIASGAGRLSRAKGTVTQVLELSKGKEEQKNVEFVEKVVGMGHTSIIDHVYLNFAFEDVTPVIEQLLIASRYCSVTIKSRREANYSDKKYFVPEFKDNNLKSINNKEEVIKLYRENMDNLFDVYQELVDNGIKVEDARYILPYSFYSQILFGADATEIVRIINKFKNGEYSHIDEAKEFGTKLYEEAVKKLPYIDVVLENNKYEDKSNIKDMLSKYITRGKEEVSVPHAINEEEFCKIDKTIARNVIMRVYGMEYQKAEELLEKLIKENHNFMAELFASINEDYVREDLKTINVKFQLPISLANLTHITRHRGVSLSIPDFVPNTNLENYIIPETIKANEKLLEIFKSAKLKNQETYNKFKAMGIREEDLIYFMLSCNILNIGASFDGETFKHVTSLRVCRKAQWEIRKLANFMLEKVEKHSEYYGKIVGANCAVTGICPEKFECCKNPYPNKKIKIDNKK